MASKSARRHTQHQEGDRHERQDTTAQVPERSGVTVSEFAKYLAQQIAAGRGEFELRVFVPQVLGGEGSAAISDTEEIDHAERIDIYTRDD